MPHLARPAPAPRFRSLLRRRDGATAVEFALILPALLGFIFGIIEVGHLMWTLSALNMAVEDAARCVSISNVKSNISANNGQCPDQPSMQTYAASRTWGMTIPKTEFQLSQPLCGATPGYQVSISHPFQPFVNWFPLNFNIQAQACFPAWQ